MIGYVGIGTNLGSEGEQVARMRRTVEAIGADDAIEVTARSSIYRSKAWGVTEQPDFLNAVVQVHVRISPEELLRRLKAIESQAGRVESYRWGPREIDLDILLLGDISITTDSLTIPHKYLLERPFAWAPILEIDEGARLPDGRLLTNCTSGNSTEELVKLEKL